MYTGCLNMSRPLDKTWDLGSVRAPSIIGWRDAIAGANDWCCHGGHWRCHGGRAKSLDDRRANHTSSVNPCCHCWCADRTTNNGRGCGNCTATVDTTSVATSVDRGRDGLKDGSTSSVANPSVATSVDKSWSLHDLLDGLNQRDLNDIFIDPM